MSIFTREKKKGENPLKILKNDYVDILFYLYFNFYVIQMLYLLFIINLILKFCKSKYLTINNLRNNVTFITLNKIKGRQINQYKSKCKNLTYVLIEYLKNTA